MPTQDHPGKMPAPSGQAETEKLVSQFLQELESRSPQAAVRAEIPPTICFSRKIKVGALETADLVASKLGYRRVFDREILEYFIAHSNLSERAFHYADKRYPDKVTEMLALLFSGKVYYRNDYSEMLFKAVLSLAMAGPAIFVGRGCHMILPRQRVLAVRMISSKPRRITRLAVDLNVDERPEQTETKLDLIDREQANFFKRVFGKSDAPPHEFDLVINCDHIPTPEGAAQIVLAAFQAKFGRELR